MNLGGAVELTLVKVGYGQRPTQLILITELLSMFKEKKKKRNLQLNLNLKFGCFCFFPNVTDLTVL